MQLEGREEREEGSKDRGIRLQNAWIPPLCDGISLKLSDLVSPARVEICPWASLLWVFRDSAFEKRLAQGRGLGLVHLSPLLRPSPHLMLLAPGSSLANLPRKTRDERQQVWSRAQKWVGFSMYGWRLLSLKWSGLCSVALCSRLPDCTSKQQMEEMPLWQGPIQPASVSSDVFF